MPSSGPRIAIVGAGVVGLSQAKVIVERIPDAHVTIVAELFPLQTTSCGSGGLWAPYLLSETSPERYNVWAAESLRHFLQLYHGPRANDAGVQHMTGYELFKEGDEWEAPAWKDIAISYNELDSKALRKQGIPHQFKSGFAFGTVIVDQKRYLTYLVGELKESGRVSLVQKKVRRLQELFDFDVVINCSGSGAGELTGDSKVYSVRGQVLRLDAPWMKSAYFFNFGKERSSYIIPNIGSVVVGGTSQRNSEDTAVSHAETRRILNDISQLFPGLENAPILAEWVGLRPARSEVRLETDSGDIIHSYGHGGSGITLAWGCALEVLEKHLLPLLSRKRRSRI